MSDVMEIIISAVDQASDVFDSIVNSVSGMGTSIEEAFEEANAEVERLTEELAQIETGEIEGDFDAVAQQLAEAQEEAEMLRDAMEEVDDAAVETGNDLDVINSSMFMQLGEQVGALGDQAEGMAQDMNTAAISVGQLATNAGIAEPQMISLINNISNATFPQNEAMAYVQALNQMGVSADKLGASATNMDRINDATGIGYTKVMQLTQGLQAVGVSADNLPSSFNAIAYAQANVNGGADTLSMVLKRQASTINEYGLNVDQLVIIMQRLSEQGVQGMKMGSELSKVLKENDGDLSAIEQSLGLTTGALTNATATTGEYEGQLQKLADEEAEHKTILDQLGAAWEDVSLSVGQFMTPLMGVIGLMGSIGSFGLQIKGLKELASLTKSLTEIEIIESAVQSGKAAIMSVVTVATTAYTAIVGVLSGEIGVVTAATMVWNAVLAMNPIMLVVLAIVALIAVIYEVGKAFGWWSNVQGMLAAIWDGVNRLWQAFINHPDVQAVLGIIGEAFNAVASAIGWAWNALLEFFGVATGGDFDIIQALINTIGAAWDGLKMALQPVIDLVMGIINAFNQFRAGQMDLPTFIMTIMTMVFNTYRTIITNILQLVLRFGSQLFSRAVTAGRNFLNGIINNIRHLPSRVYSILIQVVSRIISAGQQWVSNVIQKAQDVVNGAYNTLSSLPGKVASALGGVVDAITKPFRDAYDKAKSYWDQITSLGGLAAGGTDLAAGGFDLTTGKEFDIQTGYYIVEDNSEITVKQEHEFIFDFRNVPEWIDTAKLVELMKQAFKDKTLISELVTNPDFQNLDGKVKNEILRKLNRSRGV